MSVKVLFERLFAPPPELRLSRTDPLDYSAAVEASATKTELSGGQTVNQPEVIFVRKCEICGEARLARTVAMQSKEGLGDWTEFNYTAVQCGCGSSVATDHDVRALRDFQGELKKYIEDSRSGDRLKAVILDQCFELVRAGVPRASLLVLDRVRAFNRAAERQDELMEQRTLEACMQAEKLAAASTRGR